MACAEAILDSPPQAKPAGRSAIGPLRAAACQGPPAAISEPLVLISRPAFTAPLTRGSGMAGSASHWDAKRPPRVKGRCFKGGPGGAHLERQGALGDGVGLLGQGVLVAADP